jgi:hypothetical protein
VLAELEQRDVAAPRVAADDRSTRITETASHQVAQSRVDVLELLEGKELPGVAAIPAAEG